MSRWQNRLALSRHPVALLGARPFRAGGVQCVLLEFACLVQLFAEVRAHHKSAPTLPSANNPLISLMNGPGASGHPDHSLPEPPQQSVPRVLGSIPLLPAHLRHRVLLEGPLTNC